MIRWFEYHCYEGHDSVDAEAWYRSHQRVTVLGLSPDAEIVEDEPRVYRVRWEDGFEYDVWEDELLDSPEQFTRPDPPPVVAHAER